MCCCPLPGLLLFAGTSLAVDSTRLSHRQRGAAGTAGVLLTCLSSDLLMFIPTRTILLSVISLLNEPNTFSPANVDASVMYRKWKESKGKDREYTDIIRCVLSLAWQHWLCWDPVGHGLWRAGLQSSVLNPHFSPFRKQVLGTKVDAERDGVKVPTTLAEYCVKTKTPAPDEGSDLFYDDYYEDDEMEEEAESCYGDEDDSGNEES